MDIQGQLIPRMIGAARLDTATYEEVEHDQNATIQALIVVILASIASGIGALGSDDPGPGLIAGIIGGILGWVVFAAIAYFVGTSLFKTAETSANWGEVARALGFATVPSLLLVLGFIPVIGVIVGLVVFVWRIMTTITALKQSMELTTGRAILTAIVAVLAAAIIGAIIFAIFGVNPTET